MGKPDKKHADIRCLFICKKSTQDNANFHGYFRQYSGLFISAKLVSGMLNDKCSIESKVVVVTDNNDIDREVTQYKPTHVFIEAYWVVPEKFDVLIPLHPDVRWIVRVHSEIPFWAQEGIAMDWTMRYLDYPNVFIAPNSPTAYDSIMNVLFEKYRKSVIERIIYLPNYYPTTGLEVKDSGDGSVDNSYFNVACFGSIRPMKNHLNQAIAALRFGREVLGKPIGFHINSNRIEMNGSPVLNNLRGLFKNINPQYGKLFEHAWQPHPFFLGLVRQMDIGMQVSFTETFNIIAADFVTQGVPFVGSRQITWLPRASCADPNDVDDIVATMKSAWQSRKLGLYKMFNRRGLVAYNEASIERWHDYLICERY
jgi:hypothetical protein